MQRNNDSCSRSSICKPCHNVYTRQHYKDNKEKYLAKARLNEEKRLKFLRTLKENPCSDCNQKYHYCQMDFDHVRGVKSFNISQEGKSVSLIKLKRELDKCELVCANCHRLRTHKNLGA